MTKQQKRTAEKQIAAVYAGSATTSTWILVARVVSTLVALGLSYLTASWLANMTAGDVGVIDLGFEPGPAQLIEGEQAVGWRALYLVAAAERLEGAEIAGELEAGKRLEEGYFRAHLYAEGRRQRAATLVDMAAKLNEDRPSTEGLVGWRAILDDRTTAECREAHGKNFRADRIPAIGWPGAVHVHCRCSAGPAVPGAPMLPPA